MSFTPMANEEHAEQLRLIVEHANAGAPLDRWQISTVLAAAEKVDRMPSRDHITALESDLAAAREALRDLVLAFDDARPKPVYTGHLEASLNRARNLLSPSGREVGR